MTPISPNANKKKKEGMSTNCLFELPYSNGHLIAWVNRRHLETLPPVSRAKWRLRNERRNCILMTRHYRDLGRASDWSCRAGKFATQIWVVMRHQYGISALVSQTSFRGKTSGGVAKCRVSAVFSGYLLGQNKKLKESVSIKKTKLLCLTNSHYCADWVLGSLWHHPKTH